MATLRQTSSANMQKRPCMWPKRIGRLTKSVLQSFVRNVGKNTNMAKALDSKKSVRNSRSHDVGPSMTQNPRPNAGLFSVKSVSRSTSPKWIGNTKRNARPKLKKFVLDMDTTSIANMSRKNPATRWENIWKRLFKKMKQYSSQLEPDTLHTLCQSSCRWCSGLRSCWKAAMETHKNTTNCCHQCCVTNGNPENLRATFWFSKIRASYIFKRFGIQRWCYVVFLNKHK